MNYSDQRIWERSQSFKLSYLWPLDWDVWRQCTCCWYSLGDGKLSLYGSIIFLFPKFFLGSIFNLIFSFMKISCWCFMFLSLSSIFFFFLLSFKKFILTTNPFWIEVQPINNVEAVSGEHMKLFRIFYNLFSQSLFMLSSSSLNLK